jgi:hypothetical protein
MIWVGRHKLVTHHKRTTGRLYKDQPYCTHLELRDNRVLHQSTSHQVNRGTERDNRKGKAPVTSQLPSMMGSKPFTETQRCMSQGGQAIQSLRGTPNTLLLHHVQGRIVSPPSSSHLTLAQLRTSVKLKKKRRFGLQRNGLAHEYRPKQGKSSNNQPVQLQLNPDSLYKVHLSDAHLKAIA